MLSTGLDRHNAVLSYDNVGWILIHRVPSNCPQCWFWKSKHHIAPSITVRFYYVQNTYIQSFRNNLPSIFLGCWGRQHCLFCRVKHWQWFNERKSIVITHDIKTSNSKIFYEPWLGRCWVRLLIIFIRVFLGFGASSSSKSSVSS